MNSTRNPNGAEQFHINETAAVQGSKELRLALSGSLDVDGAPLLMENLRTHLARNQKFVALDFKEIGFVSSLGIGTLIAAIGEFREVGGDVVVMGLSAEILAVFEMLDLLDFVTVRS